MFTNKGEYVQTREITLNSFFARIILLFGLRTFGEKVATPEHWHPHACSCFLYL